MEIKNAASVTTYTITINANGGGSMDPVTDVPAGNYKLSDSGFDAPANKELNHWQVNRYLYDEGDTITIEGDTSSWAIPAKQWACGSGILEDIPVGKIRPTSPAIRAEFTRTIHVFLGKIAK